MTTRHLCHTPTPINAVHDVGLLHRLYRRLHKDSLQKSKSALTLPFYKETTFLNILLTYFSFKLVLYEMQM